MQPDLLETSTGYAQILSQGASLGTSVQPSGWLTDSFNRRIDYLRVSVTDRCNFRCVYCMPEAGAEIAPTDELLSIEELTRVVRVAINLGVRKVRLTGGEPLVRAGLIDLVASISSLGVEDLSLTTNGSTLTKHAESLKRAGLTRLNISLDTLRPDRFTAIARRGNLEAVLEGIELSLKVGFAPVKLNVVSMRGVNDDETLDFVEWTRRAPVHVRFIEVMPIRWNLDEHQSFDTSSVFPARGLIQLGQAKNGMLNDSEMRRMRIDSSELIRQIEAVHGQLEPAEVFTNGPARTFRVPGGIGTVGFISQISNDLCTSCNRLRLTADGFLRPCLMADGEIDVRSVLRSGAGDAELAMLFEAVVAAKPFRHHLLEGQKVTKRGMSGIGGA